ncbi:MAG: hypothetical protein J6Q87_02280 [Clostridia bacterium]|nr:hypothetical protein [Clostridia bacterium]
MPKIADKMEELPDYVLAEVRRLFLEENLGALKISKTIESNFGVKLPSLFVVDKYLDSLKKNNDNVIPQEEVESPKVSALEGLKIDTSSLKNQNESVKNLIIQKIETLQRQSILSGFDKDLEQTIQRYLVELSKLTINEVKVKDDFKDTEKVSLGDIKFYLNKIMSCVRTCVNKAAPDKVDDIFKDLKVQLEYTFSGLIDPQIYNSQRVIDAEAKLSGEKTDAK